MRRFPLPRTDDAGSILRRRTGGRLACALQLTFDRLRRLPRRLAGGLGARAGFDAVHTPITPFIHRRIGPVPHAQLDDDIDRAGVRGVYEGEEPRATQVTQPELDLSP